MGGGSGSFRMRAGASGRGASSAASSSTWRFEQWVARFEDGVPVVGGEVRGELGDGGEVEPPVGEHGEEDRVLARRPGGGDAQVGFGLGEVEPLGAVGVHGGRGLAGVEPACVDFADVSDEVGFVASRLAQDVGEAEEDLAVGELLEGARGFHTDNIGSDFSRAGDRACGAPRPGMRFEASEANARLLARRSDSRRTLGWTSAIPREPALESCQGENAEKVQPALICGPALRAQPTVTPGVESARDREAASSLIAPLLSVRSCPLRLDSHGHIHVAHPTTIVQLTPTALPQQDDA